MIYYQKWYRMKEDFFTEIEFFQKRNDDDYCYKFDKYNEFYFNKIHVEFVSNTCISANTNDILLQEIFIKKIKEYIKQDKEQTALKEIYSFIYKYKNINNVHLVDNTLIEFLDDDIPTVYLVSLLNSSKLIKTKLKNRSLIYQKLKMIKIKDYNDEEDYKKSLFYKLK